MTEEDEHMDEIGTLFIDECHACDTFGVAIRVLDSGNVRMIYRKVPNAALAKLLRDAADLCEGQEIPEVVTPTQIN